MPPGESTEKTTAKHLDKRELSFDAMKRRHFVAFSKWHSMNVCRGFWCKKRTKNKFTLLRFSFALISPYPFNRIAQSLTPSILFLFLLSSLILVSLQFITYAPDGKVNERRKKLRNKTKNNRQNVVAICASYTHSTVVQTERNRQRDRVKKLKKKCRQNRPYYFHSLLPRCVSAQRRRVWLFATRRITFESSHSGCYTFLSSPKQIFRWFGHSVFCFVWFFFYRIVSNVDLVANDGQGWRKPHNDCIICFKYSLKSIINGSAYCFLFIALQCRRHELNVWSFTIYFHLLLSIGCVACCQPNCTSFDNHLAFISWNTHNDSATHTDADSIERFEWRKYYFPLKSSSIECTRKRKSEQKVLNK